MDPALDNIKNELEKARAKAGFLGAFLDTAAGRSGAISKGILDLPDFKLDEMEARIAVGVFNASRMTQTEFNRLLAAELPDEPDEPAEPAPAQQSAQARPTLDDALNGNGVNGNYFKFMKQVLQTYFQEVPVEDQRAMFAACIRYSTNDSSPAVKLGALLKGAGPIMQKMLQGFNTTGMNAELRGALADMKSNLAPIHEDMVRSHLWNMVQASHGKITKIDVVKILGAASVGQVMQCRVHLNDGTEKDCVVKIRRPDVLNRAQRERSLFEKVAKGIPGMEVTFAGQLSRIMDEMDLRIEAENVKNGQIYGRTEYKDVGSMKLMSDVEPTASTMLLEKAPGTTVDKYLDEVEREVDSLYEAAVKRDENGDIRLVDGEILIDGTNSSAIFTAAQRLTNILDQLMTRQVHVANLSKVWVEEGIFKEGFYHGDLHAGNIMINDEGATFIDFGNATKLTEEQQKHIMIMMLSASSGQRSMFADSYRALLTAGGRERFDHLKNQINPFLDDILTRGTPEQAGKRIAAALKGLQDMGLELPAPIFNFSQCQQRLEGTVDGINALINKVVNLLSQLSNGGNGYSLDMHLLQLAYDGGSDPLKDAKDVVLGSERGSFRWQVENFAFATKYNYKKDLFPVLPPAMQEKYSPEVMFPGLTGDEELLTHQPDAEKVTEFWRDVEDYIEQTRQKFTQISRRLVREAYKDRFSPEELNMVPAVYPNLSGHIDIPDVPNFFTLMSSVISGYLSNNMKRAAFAMKIGMVNAWRLTQ